MTDRNAGGALRRDWCAPDEEIHLVVGDGLGDLAYDVAGLRWDGRDECAALPAEPPERPSAVLFGSSPECPLVAAVDPWRTAGRRGSWVLTSRRLAWVEETAAIERVEVPAELIRSRTGTTRALPGRRSAFALRVELADGSGIDFVAADDAEADRLAALAPGAA
ncbi:hypothetical protein ACL03H_21530 [Saccharopolyspora sp. MS10]|uniref:hypothetical protein n=1 Tax=Saccharopolyspora sp. MS10 TaxID=3385973 RepID=UPI0039A39A6D